jgi:hypothetical protein
MAAKKKRETPDTPPEPPSVAEVMETVRATVESAIRAGCDPEDLSEALDELSAELDQTDEDAMGADPFGDE